ncbi:MAG: beta-ketoacyl synthase N-terminal-like domain-containing protein [Gemmatimonadales bacterium]
MSGEVPIVGCGACTSIGRSAAESAAAVWASISRIGDHPYIVDRAGELMVVARAAYLDEDARGIERFVGLGRPAAREALAPLSGSQAELPPIPLLLGLPAERPGLPADLATAIAGRFEALAEGHARISSVETLGGGHSAGLMAIEEACRRINDGQADLCLAGGIESYLEPETLERLDFERRLHSTRNRWGLIPGEAAGFCLLASPSLAERGGLPILGHVVVAVTAWEENLINSDSVCTGRGLSEAFRRAVQPLAPSASKIDQMICDLNGERYRTDEFGFAVTRTAEHFVDPSEFLTPADCWGDVGAASGPLFVSLALDPAAGASARGRQTLIWTSSDGGERSAVVLRRRAGDGDTAWA